MLHSNENNSHSMLWRQIETLMKEKKYSQNELARRAGVNNTVISALKNGKIKKPSFDLICKIADALDISLDEFIGEKSNK